MVWPGFKGIQFIWVYFGALQKAHEGLNTDSPNVPPGVLMAPTLHHKNLRCLCGEVNQAVDETFPRDLSAPSSVVCWKNVLYSNYPLILLLFIPQ